MAEGPFKVAIALVGVRATRTNKNSPNNGVENGVARRGVGYSDGGVVAIGASHTELICVAIHCAH